MMHHAARVARMAHKACRAFGWTIAIGSALGFAAGVFAGTAGLPLHVVLGVVALVGSLAALAVGAGRVRRSMEE